MWTSAPHSFVDWAWLETLPVVAETEFIRHVRLKKPMEILIDGRKGRAVVLKPA